MVSDTKLRFCGDPLLTTPHKEITPLPSSTECLQIGFWTKAVGLLQILCYFSKNMPTYDKEEGRPAIKMRRLDGCERGKQAIWGHGLLHCICKLLKLPKPGLEMDLW